MEKNNLQILLQDLSARLPNGVILHLKPEENDQVLYGMRMNGGKMLINDAYYIEEVIPYLRPLSSMTDEEEEEYHGLCSVSYSDSNSGDNEFSDFEMMFEYYDSDRSVDWLHKNHFDYRHLIERGLALKAPENMYRHEFCHLG